MENVIASLPSSWRPSYYRTSAQAEIDLVLDGPKRQVFAIEIKRTLSPQPGKGFQRGFADIAATRGFCVMPAGESFPLAEKIEAVPLVEFLATLRELDG